nr:reverse transcriptase domain-containing protein [Tanacetum cinerariifolium]
KWGSNHNGSLSQKNKGHKVPRAHTAWLINKKAHDGSLPLCNQCKLHYSGPCTVKCGNCKKEQKVSALAECQTENKKRLDNTSKNNQNQQQPNKRQNTGRAYTARTKTMKTKSKVLKHVELCMLLEEEKPNKTLTTLRMRLKLKKRKLSRLA